MKVKRRISLLLFICFSVFLGHNLVPHHHHAEVVSVPVSCECPVEHGDHNEDDQGPGDHPMHCHAFNDVVFYKYNTHKIQPQAREISTLIALIHRSLPEPPDLTGFSSYISIKIPDKSFEYFGARSLRAPPVSV